MVISTTTSSSTHGAAARAAGVRRSITSQVTTAANVTMEMNSYMLPIGQRPVAMPRAAIDATCSSAPSTASELPIPANRCPRSGRAASGSAASGPSAPTSAAARVRTVAWE